VGRGRLLKLVGAYGFALGAGGVRGGVLEVGLWVLRDPSRLIGRGWEVVSLRLSHVGI